MLNNALQSSLAMPMAGQMGEFGHFPSHAMLSNGGVQQQPLPGTSASNSSLLLPQFPERRQPHFPTTNGGTAIPLVTQAILPTAATIFEGLQAGDLPRMSPTDEASKMPSSSSDDATGKPERILLIVLNQLQGFADLSECFWVFSQFGKVERISSFEKHGKKQILVQFEIPEAAHHTMSYLSGKKLTLGDQLCELVIIPSTQPYLKFKIEDERNKDFTQLNEKLASSVRLPEKYHFLWGKHTQGAGWLVPRQDDAKIGTIPDENFGTPEGSVGNVIHIAGLAKTSTRTVGGKCITVDMLWKVIGQYGEVIAARLLAKHPECALVQFESKAQANNAILHLSNAVVFGRMITAKPSMHANALRWSTTDTESRMRSKFTHGATAVAPTSVNSPPSKKVAFWGLPDDLSPAKQVELVEEVLTNHGHTFDTVTNAPPGQILVVFKESDHAFDCTAHLNGENITGVLPGVPVFKLCMHFVRSKKSKNKKKKQRRQKEARLQQQQNGVAPNGSASLNAAAPAPVPPFHGQGIPSATSP
eukprot:gene15329-23433_t